MTKKMSKKSETTFLAAPENQPAVLLVSRDRMVRYLPSGLRVADYIPWGVRPTGYNTPEEGETTMKKKMMECDWSPAEEPVTVDTSVEVSETDETTFGLSDDPDNYSPETEREDEMSENEDKPQSLSAEKQAELEEYFGAPEDGLDMWNNWFHGLSVRDLTEMKEEGRLPQRLSELHAFLREYREYRWQITRRDRETKELTAEAAQAVAWGQEHGVDFLDPAGAFGEIDMAVVLFGPRLVKLYKAVLSGRCGRHSVLGELKTDWHSGAAMQAMGQKATDRKTRTIMSGVEQKLRMYHTSPLAEGMTGPSQTPLAYRADVMAGRYLDEGVFDGVGREELDTVTPAASDPKDEGYRIRLWKEQAIAVGYRRLQKMDEEGKPTGSFETQLQDHFPEWDEDEGAWKPAPALDIFYCKPRLQEVSKPSMGWANVEKGGEIVRLIVKTESRQKILVPQRDYKSIWDVLDEQRDLMITHKATMALGTKGSPEWLAAHAGYQKANYWYRVFKQFVILYKGGLANSYYHHLYGEWLNGIRPSGEKIIVNYRVFTLEIVSRPEAEMAGLLPSFQKKEEQWSKQDPETRESTPSLKLHAVLFSKLMSNDMLPAIRAEQRALRDKESKKWDELRKRQADLKKARDEKAAAKTGGFRIR